MISYTGLASRKNEKHQCMVNGYCGMFTVEDLGFHVLISCLLGEVRKKLRLLTRTDSDGDGFHEGGGSVSIARLILYGEGTTEVVCFAVHRWRKKRGRRQLSSYV